MILVKMTSTQSKPGFSAVMNEFQNRKIFVIERTRELLAKCAERFTGFVNEFAAVNIVFHARGAAAGTARANYVRNAYEISYNLDMISHADSWNHIKAETIPHEVAHIVTAIVYRTMSHDARWASICCSLGGEAKRTHDELVTFKKGKTFYYTLACGKVISISSVMHSRIQKGKTYRVHNSPNSVLNSACAYSTVRPQQLTENC